MKEIDRLNKAVKLFDEIRKLYPDGAVTMSIHHINFELLDRKEWDVEPQLLDGSLNPYLTAKRKKEDCFGLTLFN